MKRLLLSILVITFLLLSSCGGTTTTEPTEPELTVEYEEIIKPIDAKELAKAYVEDKEAADTQYKDKIIHLTGVVKQKSADYVVLDTGYSRERILLKCEFSPENPQLATITVGEQVQIKGLFQGYYWKIIVLADCIVEG